MFSESVYLDGWHLFWRLKWSYIQLMCFEAILSLITTLAELFGLSLYSRIIVPLIFVAAYCVAWVFVCYTRYIAVLKDDRSKVRYNLDFRLFLRFWILVQLKLLLIFTLLATAFFLSINMFAPSIIEAYLSDYNAVRIIKSYWPWFIVYYFIFCCVTAILNALFFAKIAGGNAGVLYAFRRIPKAFFYVLLRGTPLILIGLVVWDGVNTFKLDPIFTGSLGLSEIASILALRVALRMLAFYSGSVWTILSCRLYLKSDGKEHVTQTEPLTMPYLRQGSLPFAQR